MSERKGYIQAILTTLNANNCSNNNTIEFT